MQRLQSFGILSILLVCSFQNVCLTTTSEVCLVKEQTIFKRNLVVSGDILHVTEISSPLMCMKECLAFPVCGSVNIYPDSLRCELMLHNSTDELVTVVTSSDGMTIDAGDIPQEYAGECVNHSCLLTEKCISRQSRGFVCFQYDFCDGLPASVVNAIYTIDRSRGVPIATYSCLPGAGYVGGVPKSVCHPLTKTWSVAGIVCSTTLPDGCGTPPALPVPHNVTRPYNETAYLAAYTCLDLSGQTAVDHCPMTRCTGIEQWTSGASISCSVKDCYISSTSYDGQVTCTNTGKTCQRWDQQTPHTHEYFTDRSDLHNYCRVSGSVMPWCYTTDPASRWEACPVPQC